MTNKRPAPMRLSEEGLALIRASATHLGLSQAGAIEVIVRDYARREGLSPIDAPPRRAKGNAGRVEGEVAA